MACTPAAIVSGPKGPCGAVGIPRPSAMAATFFSSHSPPTIVTSGMMTSIRPWSTTGQNPSRYIRLSPPASGTSIWSFMIR